MPKRGRSGSFSRPAKRTRKSPSGRGRGTWKMRRKSRRNHIKGFSQLKMKARWSGTTWPRMLYKKFEWENTQLIDTAGLNTSVAHGYRTTSLYDPDQTAQINPSVIDFSSFLSSTGPYRQYRVMGCKIKARFVNFSEVAFAQIQPVIQRQGTDSEPIVTTGLSQEQFDNLSTLPGGSEPMLVGPIGAANNIKYRSWYICPWLAMGVPKADYMSDSNYAGEWATNPNWWPQFIICVLGLPTQVVVQARLKVTFYVQLESPYQTVNHNAVIHDGTEA